jgi:WD40 repeat protein
LHGQTPDDLDGDDVRQHRGTRRIAISAVAALGILTIAAVIAAFVAVRRSRESISRELATYSIQLLDTDPELSLRLALQAVGNAETQQAEDALRSALAQSKVRWSLPGSIEVSTGRFSPDNGTIAAARGREVILIQPASGKFHVLNHSELTPLVQFSRDGTMIATGSWDGKARMWEVTSGKLLSETPSTGKQVEHLDFSPNGDLLLTVTSSIPENTGSRLCIWDTKTGKLVSELEGHEAAIADAHFDPTGNRIVSGSWDNTIRVWDATSGNLLRTLKGHREVVDAVAFSPDGYRIVSASLDLTVRSWDALTGASRAVGGRSSIVKATPEINSRSVKLSSSTRKAVVIAGGQATIYDPQTGKQLRQLAEVPADITRAEFSNDDRMIACGDRSGAAVVWDVDSGQRIAVFRGHKGDIDDVAFGSDGKTLLTAGADGTLRLWAIEDQLRDLNLVGHQNEVTDAIWSPDGQLVATASEDETARVWDAKTGKAISVLWSPGRVSSIVFSADSQRLLVARYDAGGAEVWNPRTGKAVATFTGTKAQSEVLEHADWSPDGSIVIAQVKGDLFRWDANSGNSLPRIPSGQSLDSGLSPFCGYSRTSGLVCLTTSDDSISQLFDVKTASVMSVLKGHLAPVSRAAMSTDAQLLAFSDFGDDGVIEIWNTHPPQLACQLQTGGFVVSMNFDPGGKRLVTTGNENAPIARVWDTKSCRRLQEFYGHTNTIESARFSPDGRLLVTASEDGTARVWDVREGRSTAILRGHHNMIFDARFSPDGRRALTASADGSARVYDISLSVPLPELVQLARQRKPRKLSSDEAKQFLH